MTLKPNYANGYLDPHRTGPIDLLTREQVQVYHRVYQLTKGEPMQKHQAAWKAAVEANHAE